MSLSLRIFTSDNVLLADAEAPAPATIIVDASSGKISEVRQGRARRSDFPEVPDDDWVDAGKQWIIPGLVDAHVHLNEPGRTDWEGFYTGTRAAASGGVTCVVDMPLNSIPPTTTRDNLYCKRKAAKGQCWVDVAFWGGLVPGNKGELRGMVQDGAKGFKGFLIESGVDEFPCVAGQDVEEAMDELKDTETVLLFHAELDDGHKHAESLDPKLYSTFLASRPSSLETSAISMLISLQKSHASQTLRSHIVHLSAASALPSIRLARESGLNLTVETCFHYLVLSSSDSIPDSAPQYKCCPPIRDATNRDKLWEALKDGTIDCVVSDHSPCTPELKLLETGNIMGAWGGISTLGLGLSLLWTEGRKRGVSIRQIISWLCQGTAKHAGLGRRKGAIRVGMDADLVVWDPEKDFEVTKDHLIFKNKLSPYEGMKLTGRVDTTYVRGRAVWCLQDKTASLQPIGELL